MSSLKVAVLSLTLLALQGCFALHASYVDPQFHHASYGDLQRSPAPYVMAVEVQFERNGQLKPAAVAEVRSDIERTLRSSGIVVPYEGRGAADGQITVTLNNVTNMTADMAKGFGTGLTWGLVGSTVTDGYIMTCTLTQADATTGGEYKHAILTTQGIKGAPDGMTKVSLPAAVNQVIDDMVLNFLADMQRQQRLLPRLQSATLTAQTR
jgi:hypothetical protein